MSSADLLNFTEKSANFEFLSKSLFIWSSQVIKFLIKCKKYQ